jgi:hypothetical protein
MKKASLRFGLIVAFSIAASMFFLACASAPTAEIAATRTAVTAAQVDDVKTYAPESLKDAEDTLSKAMAEVQTQDSKFALSRDYKAASDLLKQAKDKATKAEADSKAKKAQTKADAEATIGTLTALLADAKKALAGAPRGKDTKADLEAMQNDLKSAEEASAAATQAMSQEKFMDALGQATTAKTKATAIVEQVKSAKDKLRGKR